MARGVLSPATIDYNGLTVPAFTAGNADGHQFLNANNGKLRIVHIKNTGIETTVTFDVVNPANLSGRYALTAADQPVVIPATTGDVMIADFPASVYNQDGGDTVAGDPNYVHLDFSQVTGITVTVFEVSKKEPAV